MHDERSESRSEGQSEWKSDRHTMTRWDGESFTISVGESISEPRRVAEPIDAQFERMRNDLRRKRREEFFDGAGI